MKSIYMQVKEQALPILTMYHDDVKIHDRRILTSNRYKGLPFLHFTGDTGTHLIILDPANSYPMQGERVPYLFATADRYHILKGKGVVVRCMRRVNRQELILYFDGRVLRKISQDKAESVIDGYISRIEVDFSRN